MCLLLMERYHRVLWQDLAAHMGTTIVDATPVLAPVRLMEGGVLKLPDASKVIYTILPYFQ